MGRVQEGVRRTTESRVRGEGTREERLFDMSVREVTLLFCPSRGGGRDGRERWRGGRREEGEGREKRGRRGKDEAFLMMR